jgi:hypothetical protein
MPTHDLISFGCITTAAYAPATTESITDTTVQEEGWFRFPVNAGNSFLKKKIT